MKFAYALCESRNQGTIGQSYQVKQLAWVEPLRTPMELLTQGLRSWALALLVEERAHDGWYAAFLVEPDEEGRFDAHNPLHTEEIVWCYETEYVPRE